MSAADRAGFVARFGGVFEHSPWIAEAAFDAGLPADAGSADGLHRALCAVLATAGPDRKLALLRAHPSLAGKLALAGGLTAASSAEQASAGLDRCTPAEFDRFQTLNAGYEAKFGFPFILAVRGVPRQAILDAFEQRIGNDRDSEFATALAQVERIALLRLRELLP
ncbi:MAG: 2-oxo-4-hydroxy-4-carboxy-5-ureidoimidazoline decarboxylase [Aliidongia sp.]